MFAIRILYECEIRCLDFFNLKIIHVGCPIGIVCRRCNKTTIFPIQKLIEFFL